eukprot:ANDGO_07888.mRNA.1 20S-pre-rRNA D-site endonuclease nob1
MSSETPAAPSAPSYLSALRSASEASSLPMSGAQPQPQPQAQASSSSYATRCAVASHSAVSRSTNKCLVLDSGAFFRDMGPVVRLANRFLTVPEVVAEIRDEATRLRIAAFPYQIELREPSDASLEAIVDFAKLTGDIATLSKTDLRVLALVHTIECELNGGKHIRKEPKKPKENLHRENGTETATTTEENESTADLDDDHHLNPTMHEDEGDDDHTENENAGNRNRGEEDGANAKLTVENVQQHQIRKSEKQHRQALDVSQDGMEHLQPRENQDRQQGETGEGDGDEDEDGEEEDSVDWITPSNFKKRDGSSTSLWRNSLTPEVGCVTTDYAMQNVLLQMNLRLVSVDGMRIRKVKQWVLRCHACFTICKDMSKKFCPMCGAAGTLLRISVTTNSKGIVRQHVNYKRPIKTRGTVYSVPLPQGGRSAKNPIFAEDEWISSVDKKHRQSKKASEASDIFSPDFLQDALFDPRGREGSSSTAVWGNKRRGNDDHVPIGIGRRNPNEIKKRTGNKNRNR